MKKKCWFERHKWKRISEPYFLRADDFGRTRLVVAAECEKCGKRDFRTYHGVHSGHPISAEEIWNEVEKGEYTGD